MILEEEIISAEGDAQIRKERRALCRKRMMEEDLDELLICDPDSIWYLTGIDVNPMERMMVLQLFAEGTKAPLIYLNRLFAVDEPAIAGEGIRIEWYTDNDSPGELLADRVEGVRIGLDKNLAARFLVPILTGRTGIQPVIASFVVDELRAVKGVQEQDYVRTASRYADETLAETAGWIRIGMTERQISDHLVESFRGKGAVCGNEFIVSFSENGADAHHLPGSRRLEEGDTILIDTGCRYRRYWSDTSRTLWCGELTEHRRELYELVKAANEAAEAAVRPGIALSELDRIARQMIADAGYGEYFNHRLGHFIGQEGHEAGDVSASSEIIAAPGMIFSIEPGVYLPGEIGIRIEDLVLVTEDGCEVLNHFPKTPVYVG